MQNVDAAEVAPPQFARVPRRVAREAAAAAAMLNARGGRSLRAGDLIREAMAAGLPAVLARRGVELEPHAEEAAPPVVPEGVRVALEVARPLLEAGRGRAEVCAHLNAAGLVNVLRRTPRPWHPDALNRALRRVEVAG